MLHRDVAANRALGNACERRFPHFFAYPSYSDELHERIHSSLARRSGEVLEIGGIDRPFLSKNRGYRYAGMDIEDKPRCREIYDRFIVQSVEHPIQGEFDVGWTKLASKTSG